MINLRKIYRPIQPTAQFSKEAVSYVEHLPGAPLQDFIYCYWQLKTTQALSTPYNYRVVADGCIDIFLELTQPDLSFVMGFCKKYTEFPLDATFNYVGIRFLPSMFTQIFKIPAHELSNRYEELQLVLPQTANYINHQLHTNLSLTEIAEKLDVHFLKLIAQLDLNIDHRLYEAIDIILRNFGVLNIERDINTGISQRQLRRLFKYYIGDTAKTFSKVVQFQNILNAKPSTQSLSKSKIFYDLGYFDQAHFIKDFKHFYGVTPTKAFR
ncbi:MAG: helix-turn-helix domain-containing protein [Bacteroidota bacterium]